MRANILSPPAASLDRRALRTGTGLASQALHSEEVDSLGLDENSMHSNEAHGLGSVRTFEGSAELRSQYPGTPLADHARTKRAT